MLKPAAQPAKFSWPATGVGPRCDVGTKVNEGAHPQDENQVWAVRTPSRRCETSHSGGEAEQQERRRCWHIGRRPASRESSADPAPIRVQCDLSGRVPGIGVLRSLLVLVSAVQLATVSPVSHRIRRILDNFARKKQAAEMQLLPTLLLAAACSTSALPPSHHYTAKSRADSAQQRIESSCRTDQAVVLPLL